MKSLLKIISIVAGGVAIATVLVVSIGVALGYFNVGIKEPDQTTVQYVSVCTNDDIDRYNSLVSKPVKDDAEMARKATDTQSFADDLSKRDRFESDATCQFIAYKASVLSNDADKAQGYLDVVKTLSSQNNYPSNRIMDITSLESMQYLIDAIGVPQTNTEQMGSG